MIISTEAYTVDVHTHNLNWKATHTIYFNFGQCSEQIFHTGLYIWYTKP